MPSLNPKPKLNIRRAAALSAGAAVIGVVAIVLAFAASSPIAFEPESGNLASGATVTTLAGQSGTGAVKFAAGSTVNCTVASNATPGGPDPWGGCWPDATNTGVAGCPPLEKVNNGDEVKVFNDGEVLENKEFLNPAVIRIRGHNVTIRCIKMNGIGWFGMDSTEVERLPNTATDIVVDRVDIDCQMSPQVIGILLSAATVTRANVYNCDHFMNVAGDHTVIRDNYCHDLTDLEVVHADCVQTLGGMTDMLIEHNSFWSQDTSDIMLGQEYGDGSNYVINKNRLMSQPGKTPPAFLIYISGTNTQITNNRFTRRIGAGPCTLNATNPVVWTNNVWDDNGAQIPLSSC